MQNLESTRERLPAWIELLPLLGLLGTVLGLMNTLGSFEMAAQGDLPDSSVVISAFAPAMSTPISGLIMLIPNLGLNFFLGTFSLQVGTEP